MVCVLVLSVVKYRSDRELLAAQIQNPVSLEVTNIPYRILVDSKRFRKDEFKKSGRKMHSLRQEERC